MHQPNQVEPALPVERMKTYRIAAPKHTHWRPATCAEVDCPAYLGGWKTTVDESIELGQKQAWYIRNESKRKYTEARHANMTVFTFEAGQQCFQSDKHKARTGRPELYIVRDGDWRGNPSGNSRQHNNPEEWVDDFQNNQDKIKTIVERG